MSKAKAHTHELGSLRFERSFDEEVAVALSAVDCVLLSRKAVYASSELTSGRRAQQLQRDHNLIDASTLRDGLGAERYHTMLWSPNVEAALAFAENLRALLGPSELVISPAPFAAPNWPQPAYHVFWENVLRTRVKAVYFNDGWQFSNGCVHEFAIASKEGLPTFEHDGRALTVHQGMRMVLEALHELESHGFDTQLIQSSLRLLKRIPGRDSH